MSYAAIGSTPRDVTMQMGDVIFVMKIWDHHNMWFYCPLFAVDSTIYQSACYHVGSLVGTTGFEIVFLSCLSHVFRLLLEVSKGMLPLK